MRLLEIPSRGSFRRQIILAFVLGFFFLIGGFATYLVLTERENLHDDSVAETTSMAQALAASALPWVLANDVAGLQETIQAFHGYPEFYYAMVVSPAGRVLAHSDASKVGQFVADEPSRALLQGPHENRVLEDSAAVIDVAVPIVIRGRHVGWARVGSHKEANAAMLRRLIRNNILFLLLSTSLSFVAAVLIANRLGRRVGELIQVAEGVQAGNYGRRAITGDGADEIAELGNSLNQMLDTLSQNEQELRTASLYTRSLIEASLDPLVTISPEGKITDVNGATERATGMSRSELIGTDFSDYFTTPEKARQGYQRVFLEGSVTDYPLGLRHRDGHITDVLYNASVYRKGSGEVLGAFAAARDVTERKKAEVEREQYFKFFTASTDLMGIADPNGAFKKINPAFTNMLGYSEDEILARPFIEFVHPDDRQRTLDEMARQLQRGFSLDFENRYVCKDGSYRWLSWRANVDYHAGLTYATGRDITERKQAEERIRESEKKFRAMTDTSPLAIYMSSGVEQKAEYINPTFTKLFGYTLDEVPSVAEWWPRAYPDDNYRKQVSEEWQRKVTRAIETSSEIEPMEVVVTCKDGSRRNILWGYISTGVQNWAFGLDLTERKRAEEILRQSEEALREAQRIAHLGSWHIDLATNQVYWSEELYKMYGYDPALPPPLYNESMTLFTPESWERLSAAIARATETGEPYALELEMVPKVGATGWMLARGELVRDAQGKAARVRGVVMDITERKKAEQEVHRLNAELEQRVKERTADLESFSYSVSHDLRTPLRAIDGFSRIVLEEYGDRLDEEGKRLLGVVRDNTMRMARLIDDILAFSRLGRKEMASQEVDMQALANDVATELAPSCAGRDVKLEIGALPKARGDSAMLRQVWVNLLGNAIKFTRPRAPALVDVSGRAEDGETVYCVKDNGVGFDMQYADKLFGVFQRLHGAEEFEGTGAGLSIVKRIITRHGGRVWAESKPGEGAAFYFTIPARAGNNETGKETQHG